MYTRRIRRKWLLAIFTNYLENIEYGHIWNIWEILNLWIFCLLRKGWTDWTVLNSFNDDFSNLCVLVRERQKFAGLSEDEGRGWGCKKEIYKWQLWKKFTFSEFQIIESILKYKYVNKVKETFYSFLSNFILFELEMFVFPVKKMRMS